MHARALDIDDISFLAARIAEMKNNHSIGG
jgi:hypothetical protein